MADPKNPGKSPEPPWAKPTAPATAPTEAAKPAPPRTAKPDGLGGARPPGSVPKGKGPDPTIFVGAPSRPKNDGSEVLLVATPNAYVAITAGPRKGAQFTVQGEKMVIGREPPVDVLVEDKAASRRHAQIYRKNSRWYLRDLGSTNGTYLDGPLRGAERILWDGDVFRIGEWEFTFSDPGSARQK